MSNHEEKLRLILVRSKILLIVIILLNHMKTSVEKNKSSEKKPLRRSLPRGKYQKGYLISICDKLFRVILDEK